MGEVTKRFRLEDGLEIDIRANFLKVINMKEEYYGGYAVITSLKDTKLIAFDHDPIKALRKAQLKGVKDPVMIYLPNKEEKGVYNI